MLIVLRTWERVFAELGCGVVLARFCGVGGKLLFPCEIAYYVGNLSSIFGFFC